MLAPMPSSSTPAPTSQARLRPVNGSELLVACGVVVVVVVLTDGGVIDSFLGLTSCAGVSLSFLGVTSLALVVVVASALAGSTQSAAKVAATATADRTRRPRTPKGELVIMRFKPPTVR